MNNIIPIFRFSFRFVGKSESAKATLFSVPTPLRGRAESGIGVFRLFQSFPFFKTSAENRGER
jgi:hypothetical protein